MALTRAPQGSAVFAKQMDRRTRAAYAGSALNCERLPPGTERGPGRQESP